MILEQFLMHRTNLYYWCQYRSIYIVARVLCGMYINCACCTCVNFNQGETRKIIYVCSKSCSRIIHVRYHMFIKKCTTMYIKKKILHMWYHGVYRNWFLDVYSNIHVLTQIKKIRRWSCATLRILHMWYHGIYRKWFLGVYSNRLFSFHPINPVNAKKKYYIECFDTCMEY